MAQHLEGEALTGKRREITNFGEPEQKRVTGGKGWYSALHGNGERNSRKEIKIPEKLSVDAQSGRKGKFTRNRRQGRIGLLRWEGEGGLTVPQGKKTLGNDWARGGP